VQLLLLLGLVAGALAGDILAPYPAGGVVGGNLLGGAGGATGVAGYGGVGTGGAEAAKANVRQTQTIFFILSIIVVAIILNYSMHCLKQLFTVYIIAVVQRCARIILLLCVCL
jgi:hypothetical protein